MTLQFRTIQANCVLLTPQLAAGVISDPRVLKETEGPPSQVVQAPELVLSTFSGDVQITYLETQPHRFALTVAEINESAPSERWKRIASAACKVALPNQAPIAFGLNFTRMGIVEKGTADDLLRELLGDQLIERIALVGVHPKSAGIKLFYPWKSWQVTLSLDPDISNPRQIVAGCNFHHEQPNRPKVQQLLGQARQAYDFFVTALERALIEVSDVNSAQH